MAKETSKGFRTIYKFGVPFPVNGSLVEVPMPVGAKVLTVNLQDDEPHIWALVYASDDLGVVVRKFHWFGTGQVMPDRPLTYVGTVHLHVLVFHLFEEKEGT
jgi:hypothetical protein